MRYGQQDLFIRLVCIGIVCLAAGNVRSDDLPRRLIRVDLSGKDEASVVRLLRLHPDITHYDKSGRFIDVVVQEEEGKKIRDLGFETTVRIDDLDALSTAMRQQDYFEPFHTYSEMLSEMRSVEDAHPDIGKLYDIGDGWEKTQGLADRDIWAIKISDNVLEEEAHEPEVLYMACHHAREIITPEILLHFMHYLVDNYGTDPEVTHLVDTRQLWLVPMLNPDGHEYVFEVDMWWRKNRRDNGDGTYGVDLNRNYGYMWGFDDIGSSPIPGSNVFRGSEPFSEPETQAIRDFAETHNIVISLSYHAYGNLLLFPWGYVAENTPDHATFLSITQGMAAFNGYESGNSASGTIYPTNGGTNDWLYGEQTAKNMVFGITPEVGGTSDGFHPSHARIEPLILENLGPNLFAVEIAGAIGSDLPPTMGAILEPQNQWYGSAPTFSNFGFYDDFGLAEGWYQIDSYRGEWTLLFEDLQETEWNDDGWIVPGFYGLSDGMHTLYFKVSDINGHVTGASGQLSWSFGKDTTPPFGPTHIGSHTHSVSQWSGTNTVYVFWDGTGDEGSGVDGYSYHWDMIAISTPDWRKDLEESVVVSVSPPLEDGDDHYFHIRAGDNAGNWGIPVHIGPFYIDTSPPNSGTISINNGADTTYSVSVTLYALGALEELSGLDEMRFSHDGGSWSPPENYMSERLDWDLSEYGGVDESGIKTVYVRYKDTAGNWSDVFADDIVYSAPVRIEAADLTCGSVGIPYSRYVVANGGWSPYTWAIVSGTLPEGCTFHSDEGLIEGIPTDIETAFFSVEVTDANSKSVIQDVTIDIQEPLIGDVNGNCEIDVLDILSVINIILGLKEANEIEFWTADANSDGFIDVVDAVVIVGWFLGEKR
ncbi:MAG: hypothetical protein JSV84_01895 [Gemmatimonadota bacterium]|nr:MAG: hypothetical protein JSV84_01895 [Gemmatimonadota bacterium]